MKKIVIPTILAATVLVAGFVALMPVQQAQTVHTFLASQIAGSTTNVLTITKTLPTDGTDVDFTLTCSADCLIQAVWLDNTPTTGTEKDHRLQGVTVGGSDHRGGVMPIGIASNDVEETRDLLGLIANASNGQDEVIPLNAGQTAVFTLDTGNGANDVIVTMTVAVIGQGAGTATLT